MTNEEHKSRHKLLHKYLDELIADFITHTTNLPSQSTLLEFMEWSHRQTITPTDECEARSCGL